MPRRASPDGRSGIGTTTGKERHSKCNPCTTKIILFFHLFLISCNHNFGVVSVWFLVEVQKPVEEEEEQEEEEEEEEVEKN